MGIIESTMRLISHNLVWSTDGSQWNAYCVATVSVSYVFLFFLILQEWRQEWSNLQNLRKFIHHENSLTVNTFGRGLNTHWTIHCLLLKTSLANFEIRCTSFNCTGCQTAVCSVFLRWSSSFLFCVLVTFIHYPLVTVHALTLNFKLQAVSDQLYKVLVLYDNSILS